MSNVELMLVSSVLIIFAAFTTPSQCIKLPMKNMRIEKLIQCPDRKNTPSIMKDILLNYADRYNMTINGIVDVKKEIRGQFYFIYTLNKCKSKSEPDTCELYTKQKLDNVCLHLPEKFKPWSKTIEHIEGFIPKCPIKPNTYKIMDAPVDLKGMEVLPLSDAYWKVIIEGISGKTLHICCIVEMDISTVSRRVL